MTERGPRRLIVAGSVCAVAYAAVPFAGDLDGVRWKLAAVVAPLWVVFALAARWALRRGPVAGPSGAAGPDSRRGALLAVVCLAGVCQLPGVLVPPQSSTDAYRYVWDGRVQGAGISPYRFAPLDDRLADLRDPVLFPGLGRGERSGYATPDGLVAGRGALGEQTRNDPRTRINRPRVRTVYPPFAQVWFAGVAAVTPWSWGTHGIQLASAALAVGVTAAVGGLLRRRGRDPAQALLWGWSPVVVLESGNGAHVDVVAAALVVAAVAVAHRPLRSAALIGLAAAAKLSPLVLLPAFVAGRRGPGGGRPRLRVAVVAIGTLLGGYLAYALSAGPLVLGFLPGYLAEQSYDSGERFGVLALLLPGAAAGVGAVLVAGAVVVLVLARGGAHPPEVAALWMFGAALLVSTPPEAWYALPLVALATVAGRPGWQFLAVAGYAAYAGIHTPGTAGWSYAVAGTAVAAWSPAGRRVLLSLFRKPWADRSRGSFRSTVPGTATENQENA